MHEPSIGFCVSWGWEIGKGFSSFFMGIWEICIGIDVIGRGSNIELMPPTFIPIFNPGMPLLFSILGEFPRFVFGNPLECCCDIVTLCEFCILVNGAVVLIIFSNWLCIDICASPCDKFIFKFVILILPKFRFEAAILVGIMFTDFTSGSKLRLVLLLVLFVVWDVWINEDSFLTASVWSKVGCVWINEDSFLIASVWSKDCVVGTEAIQNTYTIWLFYICFSCNKILFYE